jgi:hypothetical protein
LAARIVAAADQSMTSWMQKDRIMLGFMFGLNARLGRPHHDRRRRSDDRDWPPGDLNTCG